MSTSRKIIWNTAVQVAGRGAGTILALATVGLMTRHLGPAGYGEFTVAISFLQFFGILADLGLTLTVAKMLAAPGADQDRIASNAVTLRAAAGLVFFAAAPLVAFAFPYPGAVRAAIAVGTISFLAMSLSSVISGIFQKFLAGRQVAVAEVAGRVVLLFGTWLAVRADGPLVAFMAALAAANLAQFAFSLAFARRFVRLRPRFEPALWKEILRETWPVAASIAFNLVYLKGDVVILSLYRGAAEVGLYGAAYKVLDVVTVVPTVFMMLVLPVVAADWGAGRHDDVRLKLGRAFDALGAFGVPLFLGAAAVAPDLMAFLFSAAFAPSGRYLVLLMLAALAVCLGSTFTYAVIAVGWQKKVFWLYGLDAALAIALYFLLIPRYGAVAAGWVTVFSEFFIAVACAVAVSLALRWRPSFAALGRATLAGLAMYGLLLLMPNLHVLARIAIGAVTYASLAYAFGAVDRDALRELLKRQSA